LHGSGVFFVALLCGHASKLSANSTAMHPNDNDLERVMDDAQSSAAL
jgi:hypothetical protein